MLVNPFYTFTRKIGYAQIIKGAAQEFTQIFFTLPVFSKCVKR